MTGSRSAIAKACASLPGASVFALVVVAVATACGGGSPAGDGAATPRPPASAMARPSPAGASPTAMATPASPQAAAAFQAALRLFGGLSEPECRAEHRPCVAASPQPDSPERGTAVFSVTGLQAGGGFLAVLARDRTGAWTEWLHDPTPAATYQLFALPGEMLVCADGRGAGIRATPSVDSPTIATLPDLTKVTAEEFLLTDPSPEPAAAPGFGWYRVRTEKGEGWAYSTFVADGRMTDCSVRNQAMRLPSRQAR